MSALKRKRFSGRVPKNKFKSNENRYSALSNLYDGEDTYSDDELEATNFKIVIPPIIVDSLHSFAAVYKLIGTTYSFKKMSIGTKIISPTATDFIAAKKKLKDANYKFYSHDLKDTKIFKLILFGLHKVSPSEITTELEKSHNVTAVSIKEIPTSRSTVDDAIYAVEFDRSVHTKSQIKKIRYLCGIVINWRNPTSSKKGPTLCSKCAMFGHGAKHCFRNNVCIACGGDHDFSTRWVPLFLNVSTALKEI